MQLKTFLNRNIGNENRGFNYDCDDLFIHLNKQFEIKNDSEEELHRVYSNHKDLLILTPSCWDLELKNKQELLKCKVLKDFTSINVLPFHKGRKILNIIIEVK